MTKALDLRLQAFAVTVAFGVLAIAPCFAAKGGKGGGKPGGGGDPPPPPATPISYSITPVTVPGTTFYFNDHNNDAAVVGFDSVAARAVVYLPSVASNQAFYLDEPSFGLTGVPSGWHTRSALGINNHGAIVGNIASNSSSDLRRPYVLQTGTGLQPQVSVLGPFDPAAHDEVALNINDSGDIVVKSSKLVDGVTELSYYVGNPGLHGNPAIPFEKVTFPEGWNPTGQETFLSNRLGTSPAVLVSSVHNGVDGKIYRMSLDGSSLEFAPEYVDADGTSHSWWLYTSDPDVNDAGDVAGRAYAEPGKKGKVKNRIYGAVWAEGSDQYVPVAGEDPLHSEWDSALINNEGDFLLSRLYPGTFDTLWHSEWSATNGAMSIADLIDPNDPSRSLFSSAREITDHTLNDWPTIIAQANDPATLLILTPHLNATPLATTAVPEPTSVVLCLAAIGSLVVLRRRRAP